MPGNFDVVVIADALEPMEAVVALFVMSLSELGDAMSRELTTGSWKETFPAWPSANFMICKWFGPPVPL